ncbi:MAG: HAMP domain-containing histidine kinase [Armatimonadetes bacterium]|nr:HAMP domain-containing histidine kinase [Armatimonadota bacterium]
MAQHGNLDPGLDPRNLGFEPELEALYQAHYQRNVRPMVRVAAGLMAALFLFYALRDYLDTYSLTLASRGNSAPGLCCLLLLGLSGARWSGGRWQQVVVGCAWLAAWYSFSGTAIYFSLHPLPGGDGVSHFSQRPMPPELLFYSLQVCLVMLGFAAFRLQFLWTLGLEAGIVLLGGTVCWVWLLTGADNKLVHLSRFLQPTLLVLCVIALMAFAQEHLARRAWRANYLLDQERNDERRRREQTETSLRILNQAIGGIVHDLGNPLVAVQTGSQTLRLLLSAEQPNIAAIAELADAIGEGGQMLDYLRVSLIEQSRVLAGASVPVERAPTSLRRIVEAGLRFQKPRYASKRVTSVSGEDLDVRVDEVRMVTVLMNLVGNALKYSDGEVRVTWRAAGRSLLIAVLDEGMAGCGLTEAQARSLFVPFGRLDQHASVEGIGLGLLSARKVVEAHDGEVYIEGTLDGRPASAPFRTAVASHPTMLEPPFRTAFVAALPLA